RSRNGADTGIAAEVRERVGGQARNGCAAAEPAVTQPTVTEAAAYSTVTETGTDPAVAAAGSTVAEAADPVVGGTAVGSTAESRVHSGAAVAEATDSPVTDPGVTDEFDAHTRPCRSAYESGTFNTLRGRRRRSGEARDRRGTERERGCDRRAGQPCRRPAGSCERSHRHLRSSLIGIRPE